MKSLCVVCAFVILVVAVECKPTNYHSEVLTSPPKPGVPVDEVIVESSLFIKNKNKQERKTRQTLDVVLQEQKGLRVKRQHHGRRHHHVPDYSQSSANAAANSNYFGEDGFGASAANAQAQGFHTKGALGAFGANSANTQTQSFTAGENGINGSVGSSLSQVYNLPNGKTINVAFSNGFSTGPSGQANSMANGITIT